jgi:hypothetical protein
MQKSLAQPNWLKMKRKITLKNGNKGQKMFTKKIECVGKMNKMKLTCFSVVGKALTLVTLVGWTLFENYVEKVAGLPKTNKIMIKNFLD